MNRIVRTSDHDHAAPVCPRGSVDTGWRTACSRYSGVYFLRLPDTGTSFPQDQRSHDQVSTIRVRTTDTTEQGMFDSP
jgi:hypothetical protein